MILTMYFACTREVIQKSLNQNSRKWSDFRHQLSIFYYVVLVRSIQNETFEIIFFTENSDFPCGLAFSEWKSPSQDYNYLTVNLLFVNRFSKFLWHFIRHLGCKMIIGSNFARDVPEHVDMQKGSFQRMV